jgi:hypothetical protein
MTKTRLSPTIPLTKNPFAPTQPFTLPTHPKNTSNSIFSKSEYERNLEIQKITEILNTETSKRTENGEILMIRLNIKSKFTPKKEKILDNFGSLCGKTGFGLGKIESEKSEYTDNDGKSLDRNSGASITDIEKDVKEDFIAKKKAINAERLEGERKVAQVSADEKRTQVLEEEEARNRERVALEMIRDLDLRKDTFTDSSKGNW